MSDPVVFVPGGGDGAARTGTLHTPHGPVATPAEVLALEPTVYLVSFQ